jgi:hypothetical protein
MTIIQTKDLTGAALDWAVAKAEDQTAPERIVCTACHGNGEVTLFGYGTITEYAWCRACNGDGDGDGTVPMPDGHKWWPAYSTSWEHAGHIIEREGIAMLKYQDGRWEARHPQDHPIMEGHTPLIAAMRAYVASKLGEEVAVPQELATEGSAA